jgi:hypothetical protein
MRSDTSGSAQAGPAATRVTIRVQRTVRGRWEVAVPGRRKGIICDTLDEARRVAYLAVARTRPCELIVHDAYHRVIHQELIAGHQTPPSNPPGRGKQPEPKTAAPPVSPWRLASLRGRRPPSARSKSPTTRQGGQ